jgi:hypothetical protein
MVGTNYTSKSLLLAEIANKIKPNVGNETTSQIIQDKFNDVVETFWGKIPLETGVAYVNSSSGNDSTAVVGSLSNKFATILAAADSSASSIIVEAGSYTDTLFLKGSFTKSYYFKKGATVTVTGNIDTPNFGGQVFGYGTFISNATSGALFNNAGLGVFFEFHSITINNANVSLLGNGANNTFTFKGNSYTNYNNYSKAFITLSYLGVFGYPTTGGNNTSTLFRECYLFSSANSVNLIPFSRPTMKVVLDSCICSASTNGAIFGRYDAAATNPLIFIFNSVLKSGGPFASTDSLGAINYVYLDNNTLSDKSFHANTGVLAGTLNVNTNYSNL